MLALRQDLIKDTGRNDDGSYSNVVDANLAVNCADTDEEFSASDVQALAADWNARYPLFGADAALPVDRAAVRDTLNKEFQP